MLWERRPCTSTTNATPHESSELLLSHVELPLRHERDLRLCLDVETGTPSARMGEWVRQTAQLLRDAAGIAPLIYGSGWFLQELALHEPPGPLWLAAYGRNPLAAYFLSVGFDAVLTRWRIAEGGSLKAFFYRAAFASWLRPAELASLGYALAYVMLWGVVLFEMHRRRIFIGI